MMESGRKEHTLDLSPEAHQPQLTTTTETVSPLTISPRAIPQRPAIEDDINAPLRRQIPIPNIIQLNAARRARLRVVRYEARDVRVVRHAQNRRLQQPAVDSIFELREVRADVGDVLGGGVALAALALAQAEDAPCGVFAETGAALSPVLVKVGE